MLRKLLFFLSFFFSIGLFAQDSISFKSIRPKPKKKDSITLTSRDYKRISIFRDTTAVDTTLTLKAMYRQNPVRRDMFAYVPFQNMGQTYTSLAYDYRSVGISPDFGMRGNRFYFSQAQQIPYFYLPTPMIEFSFKSGISQGQMLQSFFSANLTPEFNLFIRYNALRSLGDYKNILSSVGSFSAGFSYYSKNKKYLAMAHYANEEVNRQENGGLLYPEQFGQGDDQFRNRARLDVALSGVNSEENLKRYFLQHQYNFLPASHREGGSEILLKHQVEYQSRNYYHSQSEMASNGVLGQSFTLKSLRDKHSLRELTNRLGAELSLPYLGKTFLYGKSYFYNYFAKGIFVDNNGNFIPHQIKNTDYGIGVQWKKNYKGFAINAQGEQMILGKLLGTEIAGDLSYTFDEKNKVIAGVNVTSKMPNFNFLLYQSDYKNYNWYHLDDFSKENIQTIYGSAYTQWGNLSLDITNINNYTYFQLQPASSGEKNQSKPAQYTGNIQYLKLVGEREFLLGKWGLENTLMYQQVLQDNANVFNVPSLTTRNTLYFTTFMFKKAMFLQTGLTFKYFTNYYAYEYNPLLADFQVQTQEKIGNYSVTDFFLNAKVRTMRIFFTVEHLEALLGKYNYYAAPNQPYRDWKVRLGIIWYFFK